LAYDRDDVGIKICGLTNEEDLRRAQKMGADYAGFVFYPGSPRYVEPRKVVEMIRQARADGLNRTAFVGVFVDEDMANVRRLHAECGLDIVQLHGHETFDYCCGLGVPVWKAVRVKDASSLLKLGAFPGLTVLLDAHCRGAQGGSGKRIPVDLVRRALGRGRQIIVAGGISAVNLPEIWPLRPFAVDVTSSLEERPGQKSESKMRDFFLKVRELRGRS
jgi:phosphoribosylanthranilate isomerase